MEKRFYERIWGRCVVAGFLGCLAAILYLGLRPEPASRSLHSFSSQLGDWEGRHDSWSNFIAFFVLSFLGFFAAIAEDADSHVLVRFWAARRRRLLSLLGLVVFIEFAQIWIPNRVSDLRDVMMGWIGVTSAWLGCALLLRLTRKKRWEE
jgi:VanZ family protein